MKNVFIRTDGTPEMNKKCLDHLISLGGVFIGVGYDAYVNNTEAKAFFIDDDCALAWSLKDVRDISHGEIFLPTETNKHPHYGLIVKWAADTSQKVWLSYDKKVWTEVKKPSWVCKYHYHIGETPPVDLEPVSELELGNTYYIADPTVYLLYCVGWDIQEPNDNHMLHRKLVYSTPEGAIKRAKEMLGMD